MANIASLIEKFDEFENLMKSEFPTVDTKLIIDLLHRRKRDEKPMYTIEVFFNEKPNTDEIKDLINRDFGVVPSFYDHGTHVVAAHRIGLEMLDNISKYPGVEKIRGTFTGAGRGASIGPVYEREDTNDYD